jgi:hypothetical protein
MKKLLKSKELLNDLRVLKAYWGLQAKNPKDHVWISHEYHQCVKCGWFRGFRDQYKPCPIPYKKITDPIEVIAFKMRDMCLTEDFESPNDLTWGDTVEAITGGASPGFVDPSDWIMAAVLSYEAR